MQRFYLPPEETRADTLVLSEREAHHALNVVRLGPGETVMVLNGRGERLTCETVDFARRQVRLRVLARESLPASCSRVTLLQALPKGKTFDTIIQKATELGVHRVIPLMTQRVVSQVDPDKYEAKLEHWRAIAIESIKQCGSPWLPLIEPPTALAAAWPLLAADAAPLRLVASLRPGARHPSAILDSAFAHGRTPPVQIWIGPEGDFTAAELDAIEAGGAIPISLGPLVLRADTAAIYCLSIVQCASNGRSG